MSGSAPAPPASDRTRIAARDRRSGRGLLGILIWAVLPVTLAAAAAGPADEPGITPAAAKRCTDKLERLERFAAAGKQGRTQTTRFTQEEVNSYLALALSPKYHPSLKRVTFAFEESKLRCTADIDFDRLRLDATQFGAQLLAWILTGVHRLSLYGALSAQEGKARFVLLDARFDTTSLPNPLVEEIISAVGRRQEPPFDPMQPSPMPYGIRQVEFHSGWLMVYQ